MRPGTSGKVYTNTIQGLTLTLVHSHGKTQLQRKLYPAQSKRQRCLVGGEDHAGQVVYFTLPCPITNFNLQTPAHSAMINDASPVAKRSRDVLQAHVRSTLFQYDTVIWNSGHRYTIDKFDGVKIRLTILQWLGSQYSCAEPCTNTHQGCVQRERAIWVPNKHVNYSVVDCLSILSGHG